MNRPVAIFFLIVILILIILGFWYWQRNIYSKEVLKLEILARDSIQAGEQFEYLVKLKNNGKVRLENPELIFQAPDQAVLEEHSMLRVTQKIEDIYPGEERTYSFKARLFAKENETLEAKAWLTYYPKNLKAEFESKTTFTTKIDFVPLTFEFDLPSKIEGDEEISFSLNYFSNIDYLLDNLRVKMTYPDDFIFESASPQALDETEWSLPSLYQASGGRIDIKGTIGGVEGEQKVFRAQLGIIKDGEFWLLKETSQSMKIVESSLYVSSLINNSQNYIASPGELLHYEIFFKNIGKKPVQKKFLFARLQGDFFDLSTLKSDKGEIAQGDNTILWDWKNIPDLRFLDVDEEGKVEFWVRIKQDVGYNIEQPKVKAEINLGGVEKFFETKVNSQIIFNQKAYFEQEFFQNTGPLPPVNGETTTYVILWQINNTWNDIKNVKVRSVLPTNVKPTGNFFPEDAKFTYDSQSKTVMWSINDVETWQDLTLAFQIEFTPSASQVGQTPLLIEEAEISAEDDWTSDTLEEQAEGRNTTLPDDDTVTSGQGRVQ